MINTVMLSVCLGLTSYQLAYGRVIDMTYPLGPDSPGYPSNPKLKMTPIVKGDSYGFWVEYNWFTAAEHRGTHMDAPRHFARTAWTIDQIPTHHFMGPGVVFRAIEEAKKNPDFLITKEWIQNWEMENGRVPEKGIVFMEFGWGNRYKDNNFNLIFNTDDPENTTSFHFPGMHADGMEYLIQERQIHSIGMDTPSLDFGQTQTYPSHRIASKNNILILENVAKIDELPVRGAQIMTAPIKLIGGSGGPVRIFATIKEASDPSTCDATSVVYQPFVMLLAVCFSLY